MIKRLFILLVLILMGTAFLKLGMNYTENTELMKSMPSRKASRIATSTCCFPLPLNCFRQKP